MKKIFILTLSIVALSGCATQVSRKGSQDGEKSPCACFEYELFNGQKYKITQLG